MKPESARSEKPLLLEVKNLTVAYGKAEVVHGVDIQVRGGEFVALLGRNGAGKSTTLQAVSGLVQKRAGQVSFAGSDITTSAPREIVRKGIVQVLEGHRVFTTLSVEDNLLIGTYAHARHGDRTKLDRIFDVFPELADKRHQPASKLSGGQQQILAVAQGMIGDPKLMILDEPSGGLAPILVDRILDVAAELCREGTAVLLVEQLIEKALKHADHCYLMATGAIAGDGTAGEVRSGDLLQRVFLGGH